MTAGDDHLGALGTDTAGGFEPDPRAAADRDDGLSEQFRVSLVGVGGGA
jgi:hypothetical protein